MKVLLCHNRYQLSGGEDQVFADEGAMLEAHGVEVVRLEVDNASIRSMNLLRVAASTLWSRRSYRTAREALRRHRPEVMHCTNTFPLLSPSIYYAARAEGVAVVQSLHNYRLLCPNGALMRSDRVCEDCLGRRFKLPAIRHGCYRDSRAGSAVVASMLALHGALKTWSRTVDRYIALTQFARDKFVEAGWPKEKFSVKPNFMVSDPGRGTGQDGYALFASRLAAQKGIKTLIEAWRILPEHIELRIVGDGPMADEVRAAAAALPHVHWLGATSPSEVLRLMGDAAMFVLPSTWYEGMPKTIVEAFACGTPVVASRLGAMAELVDHGRTGLLCEPLSATELAASVRRLAEDPGLRHRMAGAARAEYEAKFTADGNYRQLMDIYDVTLGRAQTVTRDTAQYDM